MRSPDNPEPDAPSPRPAAESSGLVPLQPPHPDDAPTVIKAPRALPPSDPSLALASGGRLGHFELIEAVGAGGMAAVLKARDLELGRVVALKILPPHLARDPESVTRFKSEARAAAKLDHDNVARVFFCGEDQGLHFIAFEFVEGDTLRTLIERRGPLPTAECVRYMAQVAAGLAHAAERGVVHRDIKPSNIMVTPEGKAKIVDMGLARHLSHSSDGGVTQSGVTLGTFDYISPEQALDPRRADVRSDLYSLGCTFYHALTGRPPIPEGTAAKKLRAHQSEPVTDPRVLNPAVSDEMAVVLARLMAKDPAHRYQTPADLIAALTAVGRRLNLAPDAVAVDPALLPADPSSVRLVPEPPRLPVGLVAGLAVVAVAVAVLVGMPGPGRGPARPEWAVATPATKPTEQPPAPAPAGVPVPAPTSVVARNEQDLIRALEDSRITEVRLEPGRLYDLSLTKGVAVAAAGRTLTVEAHRVPGQTDPPTLRLAAVSPDAAGGARPGSLTLTKFAAVRFRGVLFEVAESPAFEDQAVRSLGLVVADVGTVELTECRFAAHATLEAADVAGVAIHRNPREPGHTTAKVSHCYFGLRRGAAVQFVGTVKADVSESGFAPHPAAFDLVDPADDATPPNAPSELTLRHCTFLMDKGAVAEGGDGVRWLVRAGSCVFAAAPPSPAEAMSMMPERPDRRSALVRLSGFRTDTVKFAAIPDEPSATFRADVPADADPSLLIDLKQQPPWELADPLAALDGPTPWSALRLKLSLPQLRRPIPDGIVGARLLPTATARLYPTWPLPSAVAAGPPARVWWPAVKSLDPDRRSANTYETWGEAVAALRPGDELQVRHDGDLTVSEEQLAKKFPVTVRPYPGSRPVLVLDPGERTEPSLFRLMEGELTLEGLEFRIKVRPPPLGEVRTASVVTLVGGKNCTLRNCVVTLEEQADEKAAAVVLADPSGVMQSAADRRPEVRLHRCLIRGKGRGVWVASARPFDLDLTHTVTALAGPVVAVDPAPKPPTAGASARVRFDHVTALLAGPLLELRPSRATPATKPGWVPVSVESERSLFAPAERSIPLMTVDGGDAAMYGTTFTWGGSGTWYGNFGETGAYLEATTETPGETRKLAADEWFMLTGERADATGRVSFARAPRPGQPLAPVTAEQLAVTAGTPADTGADVKQVARPAEAEK